MGNSGSNEAIHVPNFVTDRDVLEAELDDGLGLVCIYWPGYNMWVNVVQGSSTRPGNGVQMGKLKIEYFQLRASLRTSLLTISLMARSICGPLM